MKKKNKAVVGIISVTTVACILILTLTAFYAPVFYASKSDVAALSVQVDTLSTDMEAYYADVDLKIESVEKRVTGVENRVTSVETENDTLRALAERNARCVKKLYNEVSALGERLTEVRGLTETHGRKINDLSETVFKAAYGADWDSLGQKAWDQYVLCGNQNLWDEVVKRLTPEQMQKVIKVDQLNQRITALEKPPKKKGK